MSSVRLPGKVLMGISGRPMLERVCDRVMQSNSVKKVVIATSSHSSDDPIEQFCYLRNFSYFRGALEDVAGRFLSVIQREGAEEFIRISADSPLIDSKLIDKAVEEYRHGNYDMVTNVLHRSFPKGQSVELIRSSSYKRMCGDLMDIDEREHVTKAFYRNSSAYKIKNFSAEIQAGEYQLSVDTHEDLARISSIIDLSSGGSDGWLDFVKLINEFDL
jgi:spore coat polysaccharide biosynthesis protein SpsF (cytidylyltransferase family)